MYQYLAHNLVLVNNAEEFETLLNDVLPISSSVMSDLNKAARPLITRPTDYPILITTSPEQGMTYVPVAKVIGGMGTIRQLNMRDAFNNLMRACKECTPFHPPRIMLTGITIKPHALTKMGYAGEVQTTYHPDLMNAVSNLGKEGARLKTLRIQFGDGQFHGSVEMKEEMMFVAQVRDITDQIAHVSMDPKTGKFSAEYVFNHYDFMNATPELREYKDGSKWDIAITTSIQYTLDNGKQD